MHWILRWFRARAPGAPDPVSGATATAAAMPPVPSLTRASVDADALLALLHEQTDPRDFARVGPLLRRRFDLEPRAPLWLAGRHGAQMRKPELDQLAARPELAQAFLFHGDGNIREAALRMLAGPVTHPAVAYGMVERLNDWVPQVRDAADAALVRCIHLTAADVLAPAAWVLMANAMHWRRWSNGYEPLIAMILRHPGLLARLVERLVHDTAPGTGPVFATLCRSPHIDRALPRIAASARQPHLRARALACLATGRATWPLGTRRKVWIDRTMNRYRLEPEYGARRIGVAVDRPALIGAALRDPSLTVRKTALDMLLHNRADPALHGLIAAELARDPALAPPSLRGRLAWLAQAMGRA